jgi:hypothetical protein
MTSLHGRGYLLSRYPPKRKDISEIETRGIFTDDLRTAYDGEDTERRKPPNACDGRRAAFWYCFMWGSSGDNLSTSFLPSHNLFNT